MTWAVLNPAERLSRTTRPFPARSGGAVDHVEQPTRIVRRSDLVPGARLQGPAVISEETATTVLPPGAALFVDELRSLIIDVGLEE